MYIRKWTTFSQTAETHAPKLLVLCLFPTICLLHSLCMFFHFLFAHKQK